MPTFNSNHLQHLNLSFSQTKLHEQFSSGTTSGKLNSRSDYVRTKWQQHYNVHKVKVNWDFEYVDMNMKSCDGKLLRHCDYKNDWRSNNDGCVVFSYSVHIRAKKYRVVMVMTSRYTVGAPFEKIDTKNLKLVFDCMTNKETELASYSSFHHTHLYTVFTSFR